MRVNRKEFVEILEILKYIPKEQYNKIPKEKIELFEENKDNNYIFNFDDSKSVQEQNISKDTYTIFLILYMDYIASEIEKEKIKEILDLNTTKNEIEKSLKFNNKVFEENNTNIKIEEDNKVENTEIVVIKKSNIFFKIINKFKNLFL